MLEKNGWAASAIRSAALVGALFATSCSMFGSRTNHTREDLNAKIESLYAKMDAWNGGKGLRRTAEEMAAPKESGVTTEMTQTFRGVTLTLTNFLPNKVDVASDMSVDDAVALSMAAMFVRTLAQPSSMHRLDGSLVDISDEMAELAKAMYEMNKQPDRGMGSQHVR